MTRFKRTRRATTPPGPAPTLDDITDALAADTDFVAVAETAAGVVWDAVAQVRASLDTHPVTRVRAATFFTVLDLVQGDTTAAAGIAAQALVELARTGAPRP